ncbi:MAG: hypothetical protein COC01_01185 [Bacteroidetes bacterium]|nr:MAG: hypothetical protein COC01_01185 [Bacteroidota bacterium]
MKKLTHILLIFIASSLFAQDEAKTPEFQITRLDSLFLELDKIMIDTVKVNVLCEICLELMNYSLDSAMVYCKQAKKLSKQIRFDRGFAEAFYNEIVTLRKMGEFKTALDSLPKVMELYKDMDDVINVAQCELAFGMLAADLGNLQEAAIYYEKALEKAKKMNDLKMQGRCLNSIAINYYYRGEFKEAITIFNKSLNIAKETKNTALQVNLYSNIASCFNLVGNIDTGIYYYDIALELVRNEGDRSKFASIMSNYAGLYEDQGDHETSYEMHQEALTIRLELGDKHGIAQSYVSIGNVDSRMYRYEAAIQNYMRGLKLTEEIGDIQTINVILNNIGSLYAEQNEFEKALEYYDKAFRMRLKLDDRDGLAQIYTNIGRVFLRKNELDLAIDTVQVGLKLFRSMGNQDGEAFAHSIIGKAWFKKKNYQKALDHFEKRVELKQISGVTSNMGDAYADISNTHYSMGRYESALDYGHIAVQHSRYEGAKEDIKHAYLVVSNAYKGLNNFGNSLKYFEKYAAIKDTIAEDLKNRNLLGLQTEFETKQKEKEIQLLNNQNKIQELETDKQRTFRNITSVGLILVMLLAYMLYNRFRIKQKANIELTYKNKLIAEQKDALEDMNTQLSKKNKSISDSINYAQRIQETIMPTGERLNELFTDSFLYFKAKDVVSGDFPWIRKKGDDIFVSAVDCTGHGVPGAMMSMIGYFILNETVLGHNIYDPGTILDNLHEGVIQTLKQQKNVASHDGMDLAFCKINLKEMKLEYAGAHRPLYHLSNGNLNEIKGNRFPVGGTQYAKLGKEIKFDTQIISLKKGDSIYMYSDGLPDQLGGFENRKFADKQIQEIISENKNAPMTKIGEAFSQRFDGWLGDSKQLDDVLLIGIRF